MLQNFENDSHLDNDRLLKEREIYHRLKKYQITEAIQIRGKFLALTAEVHSVGDFVKKYHGQRKSGKV